MEKIVWIGPLVAGIGLAYLFLALVVVRIHAAEDKRVATSSGQRFVSRYGEAIVDRLHVKGRLAHLTATPATIRLSCGWKQYEFARRTIHVGIGPLWWSGLVIKHSVPTYPSRIFFLPKDMKRFRQELEGLGYVFEPGMEL